MIRHRWAVIAVVVAAAVMAVVVGGLVIATRIDDPTGTSADQPTTVTPRPTVAPALFDPTTSESSTTTSEAADDGPTILAKGEDVEVRSFEPVIGVTSWILNIDAEEQDGVVTGEFLVDNVVVTIQCAGTRTRHGDLILGGVVTDNTDGIAMVDEVNLAVGNPLALIIRNGASVTLYHPSLWYGEPASRHAGSCIDLVESVPDSLDGGFFEDVVGGVAIETADPHGG